MWLEARLGSATYAAEEATRSCSPECWSRRKPASMVAEVPAGLEETILDLTSSC